MSTEDNLRAEVDRLLTEVEEWKKRAEGGAKVAGGFNRAALMLEDAGVVWKRRAEAAEPQVEVLRTALHKIACAECTVHDDVCERHSYKTGTPYCACDARVAGAAIAGHPCPVLDKQFQPRSTPYDTSGSRGVPETPA